MRRPIQPRRGDRGFVLMMFLALLIVGVISILVWQVDAVGIAQSHQQTTTEALAEAKAALIGRACADDTDPSMLDDRPGSLPCPDTDGDGIAELFVGSECPTYVGWLPWSTLQIGDIRDGSGERLGYALSRSLRDHPLAQPINSTTATDLRLDGMDVAALVIATGAPLPGQVRPSSNLSDYLEGDNADGDTNFVALPISATFNDQLLPITSQEVFATTAYRVAAEVRGNSSNGLYKYFHDFSSLPYAAMVPSGSQVPLLSTGYIPGLSYPDSGWLNNNNWFGLVQYQRTSATSCNIIVGSKSYAFAFH
jgi:hypothetical protein